jgi:hypothetical protein
VIEGTLSIVNLACIEMVKLRNLTQVGSVSISLTKFNNIYDNQARFLPNLTNVERNFGLSTSKPQLLYSSITEIGGSLSLTSCSSTTDIFFPDLVSVGGTIRVAQTYFARVYLGNLESVCDGVTQQTTLELQPEPLYTFCPDLINVHKCKIPNLPRVSFPPRCGGQNKKNNLI